MTNDKRGQQIHDAIARRDGAVLRTLAAEADREEGRMWLTLLARMLELDARRRDRQRVRTHNLPALPAPGRAAIRRAG